jgi:hypothetical protein
MQTSQGSSKGVLALLRHKRIGVGDPDQGHGRYGQILWRLTIK